MRMSAHTRYDHCLHTMYGLRRFGIKLGLSTIRATLRGLGDPHHDYPCVHIAGTNGKGSIAASLTAILREAGHRVGTYTSPHLVRFNERITIDGREIADDRVVAAYEAVRAVNRTDREPTFFEFATAMALYEFSQQAVDWAVIETGMGGRLDATNIVRPAVSIISNVSVEHKEYLGTTLAAIASEKGGIIKADTPVVTGVRQKQAAEVIRSIALEKNAPFYRMGEHFRCRRTRDGAFTYVGMARTWRDLRPGLTGSFQFDNAALVSAACEVLADAGVSGIDGNRLRAGLLKAQWPGRLEIVGQQPLVVLDGAHNRAAARQLAEYLKDLSSRHAVTLVIGILDDKPYRAMLNSLLPHCRRVIFTRPKIDRALDPETLRLAADPRGSVDASVVPDVGRALDRAIAEASPSDAVCVAGSLYVVGEAKAWLAAQTPSTLARHPVGRSCACPVAAPCRPGCPYRHGLRT